MRAIFITIIIFNLFSCAQFEIEDNFNGSISAIPKSAMATGWILNHCENAKPIRFKELNCIQHGGEIYRTDISHPIDSQGRATSEIRQILIVQHALLIERTNKKRWCFNIVPTPEDLFKATGVKFIAMAYKRNCKTPAPNKTLL